MAQPLCPNRSPLPLSIWEGYDALDRGDFALAEPAMRSYLDSIAGYEKNRFREIEPPWKSEVARRWRRCFDEWDYTV